MSVRGTTSLFTNSRLVLPDWVCWPAKTFVSIGGSFAAKWGPYSMSLANFLFTDYNLTGCGSMSLSAVYKIYPALVLQKSPNVLYLSTGNLSRCKRNYEQTIPQAMQTALWWFQQWQKKNYELSWFIICFYVVNLLGRWGLYTSQSAKPPLLIQVKGYPDSSRGWS